MHYIFLLSLFLLTQNQAYAAAIACNAVTEVSQTFSFSGTNTWPSGTTSKSFTVGTAPNDVTLTFTHTQAAGVTPISGDPQLRTQGNVANSLAISSDGGEANGALLATLSFTTNRSINKLSYSILDHDRSVSTNFIDRTISSVVTPSGTTFPSAITEQTSGNHTISVGTGTATGLASYSCADTDNACNVYYEFNSSGITSSTTQFRAMHTGTSTQQGISFNQYAWCLPRMPTVKVQKITTGHTGAGGTFTFADTNLTGTIASISTTAPSTATPASPTALPATTINTDVTITETPASGFALSSATCSDANSGSTGNPASFGSLAGNVLTIPATNMRAGADITCTFTNRKTAQLTLRKTWTNAKVNDAVTVTTAGGTVNPSFASVANSANETDTGTATTVFAGETLTFTEPFSVGSAANYNASLSCTGATDTNLANGLTINAADSNITCTYTNTRKSATLRLAKAWGANSIAGNVANIGATTGLINNTTALTSTASTNTNGTAVTVYAGETATLPAETMSTGTLANYTTSLSCDNGVTPSGSNGQSSNTVSIPNTFSGLITCTYTNTRKSATLRLAKAWGANSIAGNVANIGATTGLINNTTALTSTASTNTNGTAVTVYAGETATLPAETMSTGTLANYTTSLSCDNGVTPSGANGQSSNTVSISNTVSGLITCTYTNTRKSATLRLAKAWGANSIAGNVANIGATTGLINNTSALTSTASTNTNGTTVTVYAGETATLPAETMSTGTLANYTTSLSCDNGVTPSGSNGQSSNTVSIPNTFSGLITCTYTNTRKSATLRLAKAWGANSISGNVANIGATTGGTNNTTAFTSTASTATNSATVTVYAGDTLTLPAETMSTGTLANYTTTLSCDNGVTPSGSNGQSSNTISIPNTFSGLITCTYTNTRKSATLRLAKAWGANSIAGNVANIGATTGGTNNTTAFTSTASTSANSATVTVYAGDTLTLPAETMSTGTLANYTTSLSCDNGVTPSGSNGQSSNTVSIPNTFSGLITCTYTNTRKSATLRLAKAWGANSIAGNVANIGATTGLLNNTTALTSTASTNTNGTAVTVFAGEVATLPAETMSTGSLANYNTVLSCDNGITPSGSNGQSSNTVTIPNTVTGLITCTYTNTRKSATFRIAKAWGANSITGNVANIGVTTGLTNNTSALTSTASTNTNGTAVTVFAGETVTLPAETMSTGTLSNYNTVLSCTADAGATANSLSGTNGQSSNTLTIGAGDEGKVVTCTYTNTRRTQSLTLAKQWTNAASGHTATVTTTGGTNNSTFNSTAPSTGLTGTTVTVYAGDVVTLPVETFGGGASVSDYNSTVACTGGTTLASGAVGRNITISNSTTATTCTYSNTGLSDMVPTLTYMPNTGIVGSPYYGKFTCTNNGIAPATAGATCAISLPAGLSATCSPTVPTASTVAVGASINCTVTGTPTTSGSGTLVLTTGATNDSNGGTTTGGNNQVSQAITIVSPTTAPSCSSGTTSNLLSSPNTEIYYDNNTNTPITNSFGLVANLSSYVRTGSNFVVQGNWRWRNANPAAGSPAMTYQLLVNGTVYAELVGTASGQEVGTLTALNGASLDGGLTTMQVYDYSVSSLAALAVSVTLPSSVTSITSASMSFVSSTTPADDAGLAPTVLNACALPKLTLSKVSQGGVGAFAFTGNNGFSNETITTTVAGTSVAGTTQTLSAVSTTTTISETIPSGYNVTDISCTGLGSGNATPNLVTGSVVISDSALVYGANIACTYTNTKLPTITISKISQGGTGTFSFTGTNGFASQNITTSSVGVAVAGATQTLSAAATATTITETIPSGYTVTDISCTGLGAGSATPNLVGGSVSLNAAATAAGANIACTFTNTKLPTITISKISQGGIGSFSFTGTNGFAAQNITTSSVGVAVAGTTQTLSAAATATTITETIPSGYTVTDISCTGLGAGSATPNLVGGSVSLNAAATAAGANISCTFTNTLNTGYTITGKVFYDNGKNAATPHNGIQEVDEQGIGNALVRLTNCSSTVYQTTVTDGSGGYTLSIPNSLSAGTTLCVEEYQQPANLVSVSGNVGTTGGSYTLATDKVQFILAASTNYTGVNFGDVVQSQLTGTGNQTIPAGTTASYGHQFIAGTEGSVTFSTAQAPTPLLAWTSLVYLDANCNALLDGGDTQITSAINVVADQVVCLVQKVISPSTAANGSQDVSTLSASFVYAAPSAIIGSYSQPDTTLIMDGGLVLVKKVREVSSCPSTGADSNVFTTNNQALPNALIEYQIVYSNPSANVVSDIVINDMTPSFTTFRSAACYSTPSSVLCSVTSSPSVGGVGSLQWVLTDNPVGLGSGQSGEVRFCVRVDQ